LSGGERAVVLVSRGRFYVAAFSVDPYSPDSDAMAWRSPRTRFQVASAETLRVLVKPAASGSTYTGGWTIRAANKITGANAGGPRRLAMGTRWAARVAQF